MIGGLKGKVDHLEVSGRLIVEVGGVGYEVFMPLRSAADMRVGQIVALQIYTHVREDQLVLYGFENDKDKDAFLSLIGISGIGPKVGLSILSVLDAGSLARAIQNEDKAVFKKISGVGNKTMQRIFIELRDKVAGFSTSSGGSPAVGKTLAGNKETALMALVQMGFRQKEAEAAISSLDDIEDADANMILRQALASLS